MQQSEISTKNHLKNILNHRKYKENIFSKNYLINFRQQKKQKNETYYGRWSNWLLILVQTFHIYEHHLEHCILRLSHSKLVQLLQSGARQ